MHIVYLIDMNVPNMKTNDSKEKQFRQLSDEELEKVTGGIVVLAPGKQFTDIELCKMKNASDQCIENGQQLPNGWKPATKKR